MNAPSAPGFAMARQREVVAALREVLPTAAVLFNEEDTRPYECDGLSAYRQLPMVVVLPENEAQVIAVLSPAAGSRCKSCRAARAPACLAVPHRSPMAWCCPLRG